MFSDKEPSIEGVPEQASIVPIEDPADEIVDIEEEIVEQAGAERPSLPAAPPIELNPPGDPEQYVPANANARYSPPTANTEQGDAAGGEAPETSTADHEVPQDEPATADAAGAGGVVPPPEDPPTPGSHKPEDPDNDREPGDDQVEGAADTAPEEDMEEVVKANPDRDEELPATPKQAADVFTEIGTLTTLQGKNFGDEHTFEAPLEEVPQAIAEHLPAPATEATREVWATQRFDHTTGLPKREGTVGIVSFSQLDGIIKPLLITTLLPTAKHTSLSGTLRLLTVRLSVVHFMKNLKLLVQSWPKQPMISGIE
jgi:hypothetical protein